MNAILLTALLTAPALGHGAPSGAEASASARDSVVYRVRQTTRLDQIAEGSKRVAWWISIPDDERTQEVLDLRVVSAPGTWSITRDAERGNRFLRVDVEHPATAAIEAVVEFTLRREAVLVDVDPERVGALTDSHRRLFREELDRSSPNMEVSPRVQRIADRVCGDETNVATQTRLLLDYVADAADHYSKDPSKPSCGIGSTDDCLTNLGGCCTDIHSLFISLARARGIPARLQMGYRLLARNVGKEVDPGYRCWAEYFAPGYGWVPTDIVEADAPEGLGRTRWFSGLTTERLWLNQGRAFVFDDAESTAPVNHMSLGYAEIDGSPARVLAHGDLPAQLSRTIRFERVDDPRSTALD